MVLPNEIPNTDEEEEEAKIVSPFIDGTCLQYAWDATCLEDLKRCPRLYYYQRIENWRPKGENIHLRFGGELHRFIQDYELLKAELGKHNDAVHYAYKALRGRVKDWEPEPELGKRSEELKSKEALLEVCVHYADHYEMDPAETVFLDGKPAVELSFFQMLEYGPEALDKDQTYVLCGHLDKVVRLNGELFVMDHKTTTSTPSTNYFRQFDVNNQMTCYTFAAQQLFKNENATIRGVLIDAIQILKGWSRPERAFTLRTEDRLKEWEEDTKVWLRAAERYAQEEYWPQNDTACDKYGGCRFRDVCSKPPRVREKWLQSNFTQDQEPWNPLKVR
jgi:hypothetical protein